jgi:hypothetical protein
MAIDATANGAEKDIGVIDSSSLGHNAAELFDPAIEKRLKLKLDLIVIPILALTYLFK